MSEDVMEPDLKESPAKTEPEMKQLPPLAQSCVDKAMENMVRKLSAGVRNKKNSQPNKKNKSAKVAAQDSLKAASAKSAQEVSNRGAAWKEMIQKSLSHGISSLKTLQFDGEFTVKDGVPQGLENAPTGPGVYVVYDKTGEPCYVGDSGNVQSRWNAGHLNENKQKAKHGEKYKMADEFQEGCTVKFIKCESVETAAAIEAHLIKEADPRVNQKEELKNEQGTRSNQEAKKMKDSSGGTATLAKGAAIEGLKQGGTAILEDFITTCINLTKDELIDVFLGGEATMIERIERFFKKIWQKIVDMVKKPLELFKGVVEFVINAISDVFRKIYNLARNVYDLGVAALELYKGNQTMSKEELVEKISEVIITSGALILWDALDAVLENYLTPLIGPVAPYLAATLSAIGFGVSSHYLCKCIPAIVEKVLSIETGHHVAQRERSAACMKLVDTCEMNMTLVERLKSYTASSWELCQEAAEHTRRLSERPNRVISSSTILGDVNAILNGGV